MGKETVIQVDALKRVIAEKGKEGQQHKTAYELAMLLAKNELISIRMLLDKSFKEALDNIVNVYTRLIDLAYNKKELGTLNVEDMISRKLESLDCVFDEIVIRMVSDVCYIDRVQNNFLYTNNPRKDSEKSIEEDTERMIKLYKGQIESGKIKNHQLFPIPDAEGSEFDMLVPIKVSERITYIVFLNNKDKTLTELKSSSKNDWKSANKHIIEMLQKIREYLIGYTKDKGMR